MEIAEVQIGIWQAHIRRLEEKIDFQERQIANLERQIERTGDREGLEPDIRRARDRIDNLRRQIRDADDTIATFQQRLDNARSDARANRCDGLF